MNIFTQHTCYVCDNGLLPKNNNGFVLDGFIDKDTNQIVCRLCRDEHYLRKNKSGLSGLYSETPLTANYQ